MLQISDIIIGEVYFLVTLDDGIRFNIELLKPTKVWIDEEKRGPNIILLKSSLNKGFIYWVPTRDGINPDKYENNRPFLFDDIKRVQKYIEYYAYKDE